MSNKKKMSTIVAPNNVVDCLDKQRLFEIQIFQRNNFTNQLVDGFLYAVSARS